MFVSGHFARKSFLPEISLPAYLAEILPPIQRLSFEIRVTSGDVIWPFDDVLHDSPPRRYFSSVISVLSAGTWMRRKRREREREMQCTL